MMTIVRRLIHPFGAIVLCVLGPSACTGNGQPMTDMHSGEVEHRSDAGAGVASAMMNAMAKMDHDIAGAAMSFSSVSVIANALRLRNVKLES